MGGRPQAASLVQGLRPRNAPLQNHASPTGRLHSGDSTHLARRLATAYAIRLPEWQQTWRDGQERHCI